MPKSRAGVLSVKSYLLLLIFLLAIAITASCGGGSGGGGGNSGGGSGGSTSGVGPAGGTVDGAYGAQVIVPAGALASTVDIAIARESANAPDFPPIDIAAVGATYEITPHGTPFALPVTVRVPFDATQVPTGTTPTLYKAEPGGEFSEIPTTVDGNMLVAQVTDFSNFISAAGYPYLEFAYSTGANAGVGTIYGYSIDAADGALTPTTQGTYANGNAVMNHATDRDGRYYYAVSPILGAPIGSPRYSLKQYTIESDGALAPLAPVSEFTLPVDVTSTPTIVIGPTGKYAYIVGGSANPLNVLQYSIGTDGALAPLSTPAAAGGGDPSSLVVAPSGKYAYTVGAGEIRQYNVAADGALTAMSTPTAAIATGTSPRKIVVAPSGKYAYVLNNNDSISQYIIGRVGILGTPGMLMLMTPATIATGSLPTDITVYPSGKYVYVTNAGDTTLSQYEIGANGALAPLSPATVAVALPGSYGMWISVDPSGQYAYIGKWDNTNVLRYRIGQGALTALGTATTINVLPGKMVFAKKPITPAGPNTGVVSSSPPTAFHGWVSTDGSSAPTGGTSSGSGPFNFDVGFSGFGGWILGDGGATINCEQGSLTRTKCSAMVASGVGVFLRVTHTDANTYNVTWGGACSGTNFSSLVIMNSSKGCSVNLIPCNGTGCTSR